MTEEYCIYVRPPINDYKTLNFRIYDEIMQVGYNHTKSLFARVQARFDRTGKRSLGSGDNVDHAGAAQDRRSKFCDFAEFFLRTNQTLEDESHYGEESDDEYTELTEAPIHLKRE